MCKMLIVVLIPLTIMASITVARFSKSLCQYLRTQEVIAQLDLSIDLGDFLLALQKERDMSSLYVGNIGLHTKNELLHAYQKTDDALRTLSIRLFTSKNSNGDPVTRKHYQNHIHKHRYNLDTHKGSITSEVEFYSKDTEMFLQLLYNTITQEETGLIWKSFAGFQELLMANEYIGQERGYGINYFLIGSFKDKSYYLQFLENQDNARTHFETAKQYSEIAYNIYQTYLENKKDKMDHISQMRDKVRSNEAYPDGSVDKALWWFTNMSIYANAMANTQNNITAYINSQLADKLKMEFIDTLVFGTVFLAIMIICPVLSISVYMMTCYIQKYSQIIAQKTKALSREKRQSQTILYQMLPKTIAKHLLDNGTVDAEHFQECTILQSDMVGFTRISASSSPLQVTNMLNMLFSCFDSRIAVYDTYKVETIGDGYMVVSGVPKRNGKRHASEIATLALDLLYHVNKLELPHRPEEKYSLRMGCHTGPVVAGVVGLKNPRYSIFGSSVQVVDIMEASGNSNMIHISETTFNLLEVIGGFEMELRGAHRKSVIFNSLQGLGIPNRTYWLLKKNNQEFDNESYSECSGFLSFGSSLRF